MIELTEGKCRSNVKKTDFSSRPKSPPPCPTPAKDDKGKVNFKRVTELIDERIKKRGFGFISSVEWDIIKDELSKRCKNEI